MIKGHEKFRVLSEGEGKDFFIEVNWNPKDEKITGCKILKVIFPNRDITYMKKEHFMAILFAIGNEEEQRKMIPQKLTRVKWYETVVSVKATKDIRRGENLTFPIKITLPAVEEEVVGDIKREAKHHLLT